MIDLVQQWLQVGVDFPVGGQQFHALLAKDRLLQLVELRTTDLQLFPGTRFEDLTDFSGGEAIHFLVKVKHVCLHLVFLERLGLLQGFLICFLGLEHFVRVLLVLSLRVILQSHFHVGFASLVQRVPEGVR